MIVNIWKFLRFWKTVKRDKKRSINTLEKMEEVKRQLQSNFNIFLEGHLDKVINVAVSQDNKYIISGSFDYTIRIWNILEKRQETVVERHLIKVASVAVTNDNKYIISGSSDKTINRQETLFKVHLK